MSVGPVQCLHLYESIYSNSATGNDWSRVRRNLANMERLKFVAPSTWNGFTDFDSIRKWACINASTSPKTMQNSKMDQPGSIPKDSPYIELASKHREVILESATRLNNLRGRYPKKRKSTSRELETSKRSRENLIVRASNQSIMRFTQENVTIERSPLSNKNPNVKAYLEPTKRSALHLQTSYSNLAEGPIEAEDTSRTNFAQDPLSKGIDQVPSQLDVNISTMILKSSIQDRGQLEGNADTSYISKDTISKRPKSHTKSSVSSPLSCSPTSIQGVANFGRTAIQPAYVAAAPLSSQSSSSTISSGMRPFLRKASHETTSVDEQFSLPRMLPALRINTCFRIAEVSRRLKDLNFLVELYAIATQIDNPVPAEAQTYRLADLFFPSRPPYLTGTFSIASWRKTGMSPHVTRSNPIEKLSTDGISSSNLRPFSSIPTSKDDILVRAMIRPSQPTKAGSFPKIKQSHNKSPLLSDQSGVIAHVHIETMRKSDWEEVGYVRGIVDPEGVELEADQKAAAS